MPTETTDSTVVDATTNHDATTHDDAVEQNGQKLYKEKHVLDLRKEAQRNRERAERAEAEAKKAADEAAELRTFKDEVERKRLEEERNFQEIAEKDRKRAEKLEKELTETKTTHQQAIARERVRAEAIRQGILDEDDVDMFDISSITVEDGKYVGVKELIASIKEAKPHKFGSKEEERATVDAPLSRPGTGSDGKPLDARKMSKEDFAALDARLKSGKV